jgi:hypothetical protein
MMSLIDYSNYLRSLKNPIIKIILVFFLLSTQIFAQEADSVITYPELGDSGFVMQKSPTWAMLRSAVIPGWGQFYNESYWKIPIIWGLSAWFLYVWNQQNDNYLLYKGLYNQSLSETSNGISRYKELRDFYRDDRDLFAVYLGLTYFLNIIDAYVDAHLYDFDVGINNFTKSPEIRFRLNL